MGHQATIVAPDYEVAGDRAEQDGRAVLEVIRLPSRRVLFDPEDRLIKASALPAALARLALRRWDVIHIHTPFRAHALGLRLAKLIRCPTVETYHTHFEEYVGLYLPLLPSGLLRAFANGEDIHRAAVSFAAAKRNLVSMVTVVVPPSVCR